MHSRVVGDLGRGPAALTSPTAYHWPTCRTRCEGMPTAKASTTQPTNILHAGVVSNPDRDLLHSKNNHTTQPSTDESQMQSYDSYNLHIYR